MHLLERWFESKGWAPWAFQREAWHAHASGRSGLIHVATGAGKTYAAFGGPLAELVARKDQPRGLKILYVTPLKALVRDVELALQQPVHDLDLKADVASLTGDTTNKDRSRLRKSLPEVLVTTPESLALLISRSDAGQLLTGLQAVIVDEWHELLTSKRGILLQLTLSRLRSYSPGLKTWGISATLANPLAAAEALLPAGAEPAVIRSDMPREIHVETLLPPHVDGFPWAGHLGLSMLPPLLEQLDVDVSNLIFTNTRSQAERWYKALLEARPAWAGKIALHHGSIGKADREAAEQGLKDGSVRIVVATSSLDLGVDFPEVERVYQIGSPKALGRLIQRAGRSSHRPLAGCTITGVPSNAWEIVEYAAAREGVAHGQIEARPMLSGGFDVLVQHLVSCALGGGFRAEDIGAEVRGAHAYAGLSDADLDWCLRFITTGGNVLDAYPAYRRVLLEDGVYLLRDKRQATLHRMNIGTIVGDEQAVIKLQRGKPLGRIDEAYVARLKPGDTFVFGGRTLELVKLHELTAIVRLSKRKAVNVPSWQGTGFPLSTPLGNEMRALLADARDDFGGRSLNAPELLAAKPLFTAQARSSNFPGRGELLVETWTGKEGRHLFVYPFAGKSVNEAMAAVLALRLSRKQALTFATSANDYGFSLICSGDADFEALLSANDLSLQDLAVDLATTVDAAQISKRHFREIARVSGLVRQTYPRQRKSGSALHVSTSLLYATLDRFDPGHPLVEQAKSEATAAMGCHGELATTMARLLGETWIWTRLDRPSPLAFPLIVERVRARLGSESIEDRVARMIAAWTAPEGKNDARRDDSPRRRNDRAGSRTRRLLAGASDADRRRPALGQKRDAAARRSTTPVDPT